MRKMFAPLELEIKPLNLDAGKWLKDAFQDIGENFMPSNIILDKTITGIGATSMELDTRSS